LIIAHAIPEQQENTYHLCQTEHDDSDNERPHRRTSSFVHVHVVIFNTAPTMVGKLKSIRERIPEEYYLFSEIAHPHGVGAVGFFADMSHAAVDMARFFDSSPVPRADLRWIFVASYFLDQFEAAMDRIEAELPALSTFGAAQAPSSG
jgi:hypothetical protein